MVLKETGIAQSTWSEEQNRLIERGLLEKKQSRVMNSNIITRVMNYRLTDKGRLVAHNLTNISRIMTPDQFLPKQSGSSQKGLSDELCKNESHLDSFEMNDVILECIEVGLESFGMNLDKLVKEEVQSAGIQWRDIPNNPEKLVAHLAALFGRDGSLTIEQMIAANIKSRFELRSISTDNLPSVIGELRVSSQKVFGNL
jgi:DNA-binding MarR family transcriptional regulator